MTDYISPILGEVTEEIYNHITTYKSLGFQGLLNVMKRDFNYGSLRTSVLFLETEFIEPIEMVGAELNTYLLRKGLSSTQATYLVRLLATNQTLVDDIKEKGFDIESIVYGLDLKGKLKELGLKSRTITPSFSMESKFTVYPVLELPEYIPPPPPPEEEIWRPFEISMLINCETKDKTGRVESRSVEFRGTFIAEKYSIVDWENYNKKLGISSTEKLLRAAVKVGETVLGEYAMYKGYESLVDCSAPTFNGFNQMEDSEDIIVQKSESEKYETITNLEVVDIDYERTPFTDKVKYIGHWWKDENYAVTEMKKQIPGASRW